MCNWEVLISRQFIKSIANSLQLCQSPDISVLICTWLLFCCRSSDCSLVMSSKILYSLEELDIAVQRVKNKELSYRKAESKYSIPRSTLSDHVTGKSLSLKRGPPTVLTEAEEQMLVDWALHMADIHVGYGRTREQLCATVKEIIDKDGRENPFVDNYPGKFNCPFTQSQHVHTCTHTHTHHTHI